MLPCSHDHRTTQPNVPNVPNTSSFGHNPNSTTHTLRRYTETLRHMTKSLADRVKLRLENFLKRHNFASHCISHANQFTDSDLSHDFRIDVAAHSVEDVAPRYSRHTTEQAPSTPQTRLLFVPSFLQSLNPVSLHDMNRTDVPQHGHSPRDRPAEGLGISDIVPVGILRSARDYSSKYGRSGLDIWTAAMQNHAVVMGSAVEHPTVAVAARVNSTPPPADAVSTATDKPIVQPSEPPTPSSSANSNSKDQGSTHHSPWYVQCIAGAGAGAVAAVFVSPLDVIRMRMQVLKTSSYDVFGFAIMKRMIQTEGVRSLYYGLGANLLALIPNWLVYFLSYSEFQNALRSELQPIIGRVPFDMLASVFAGALTTLSTHPLWLVKARMQVQNVSAPLATPTAVVAEAPIAAAVHTVVDHHDPAHPRSSVPAHRSIAQVGSQAGVPEAVEEAFERSHLSKVRTNGGSAVHPPAPAVHAIPPPPPQARAAAAAAAEAAATSATQGALGIHYRNTFHALHTIRVKEGIEGWYRGLSPQLFGLIHVGVQYPLYEYLKRHVVSYKERFIYPWAPRFITRTLSSSQPTPKQLVSSSTTTAGAGDAPKPKNVMLNSWDIVFASTLSKLVACAFAYPHEVLRSRFQTQHHLVALGVSKSQDVYNSLFEAIKTIYRTEGLRGFYHGLPVSLLRSVPACVVTFLTYESILRKLDPKSAEV